MFFKGFKVPNLFGTTRSYSSFVAPRTTAQTSATFPIIYHWCFNHSRSKCISNQVPLVLQSHRNQTVSSECLRYAFQTIANSKSTGVSITADVNASQIPLVLTAAPDLHHLQQHR